MSARLLLLEILLFVFSLYGLHSIQGVSWHQGCFRLDPEDAELKSAQPFSPRDRNAGDLFLVSCARQCWKTGWVLVALRQDIGCLCLNDTAVLQRTTDSHCTLKCSPEDPRTSLLMPACGGTEAEIVSVYMTAGPYLLSASLGVTESWVVSTIPQTLQASAHLAPAWSPCEPLSPKDGSDDNSENHEDEEEKDDWQRELVFVWEVEGQREKTVIRACTPSPMAYTSYTFNHTGDFVIDLTVRNALSSVTTSHRVTVQPPRPWGLRLSPYHQLPLHTPSCLNHHHHHHHPVGRNSTNIESPNLDPKLAKKTPGSSPFSTSFSPPNAARPTCGDNPIPLLGQEVRHDDLDPGTSPPPRPRSGKRGRKGGGGGRRRRRGRGRKSDTGKKGQKKLPVDSYWSSLSSGRPRESPPRRERTGGSRNTAAAAASLKADKRKDTTTTTTTTTTSSTTPTPVSILTARQRRRRQRPIGQARSGRTEDDEGVARFPASQTVSSDRRGKRRHARVAEMDGSGRGEDEKEADDDDDEEDVAEVAAFAGEPFLLLAGVRTGRHPQFRVARIDRCRMEEEEEDEEGEREGEGVVIDRGLRPSPGDIMSATATPACPDDKCLSVVKSLLFPKPGVYLISVIAWNQFGQDMAQIRMVVVDRRLGNVTFSVQPLQPQLPAVFATNHTITFSLTLQTADRYNTILYVIFGDGRFGFASLRETKSQIAIREAEPGFDLWDVDALMGLHSQDLSGWEHLLTMLTASYGEGCELSVEFPFHYREEGAFTPLVLVVNNITGENVTRALSSPLHVLNRLQNASLHVKSPVAAGEQVRLSLHLQVASSSLTVQWLILDKLGQVIINKTTEQTELSVVFRETEVHRVTAVASNPLGKVKASASIHVQRSIGEVQLFCNPYPPQITVEEEVECRAEVKDVEHVTFEWSFGDSGGESEVESSSVVSRASHRYVTPGLFNIGVLASNNVSSVMTSLPAQVVVDAPVRCLRMDVTLATPGQEVLMQVTALGGTEMQFQFGSGDWVMEDVQKVPPETTATVSRVYDRAGVHPLRVYAHNTVSSAELAGHVVVQPLIMMGELQLKLQASADTSAVLLVRQGGKLVERKDIIFHLQFSDGTRVISASPVVVKNFTSNGTHSINLTAFNQVDSVTKILHVELGHLVGSPGTPRLYHDAIVAQNDETVFTILGCPKSAKVIEVHHSDGTRKVFGARTSKWSHVFSSPGVQSVEVTIYGGRAGGAWRDGPKVQTVLMVQQPIRGLQLTGPTHVGIGCYNEWKAKVLEGTHLVCQWSFGGEMENHFTTILQYGRSFETEGLFTLGLHCQNDISQASAAINITVYYPVTDVRLTTPVTVHTHPTRITVTVHAGRHFTLICNFGDRGVEEYVSSHLQLVRVPAQFLKWQEPSPVYNVTIQHLYADVGAYNVSVTVSNEISFWTQHRKVFVEEAIGDIAIFADIPEVIDLNKKVEWTFTAVVGSGRNLQFAWVFDDRYSHGSAISEGNTSIATHEYDKVGEYEVMVKVWNHLQKTPVVAHFPNRVLVQERLTEVTIMQVNPVVQGLGPNRTYGAYFSADDNQSDLVVFEARTEESPVMFLFDFGDGQTEKLEGVEHAFLFYTAQAKHRYTSEGIFTITVTASNAVNSVETKLSHRVYVQVPVLGPLFKLGQEECTRFGQYTMLIAKPQQGSNVTFDWKLDDQTQLVNAGPEVQHKYRNTGLQTVEVTAKNQVSNTTSYIDVSIMEAIQSVQIVMESPSVSNSTGRYVVAVGEKLEHKARVTPDSPNIVQYFLWDFSRYETQTKEDTVSYHYPITFKNIPYRVTVTAVNCHSNATSVPLEVVALTRITNLVIKTKGEKLVNRPITFSAFAFDLTSVNYTWNFGDGSPPVQTKDAVLVHVYKRVGLYIVKLVAENPLGTYPTEKKLFVLTHHCEPPVVTILDPPRKPLNEANKPDDLLQMLESQSVHLESRATLNCSVSGNLSYQWGIHRLRQNNWTAGRDLEKIDSDLLKHPDLLLPPHSLKPGYYVVSLKVKVNETKIPVYEEVEVKMEVHRSQVQSVISGGVLQQVSRGSNLTLDGAASVDSKGSAVQLKYNWSCRPLMQLDGSCFNDSLVNETAIKWNHSSLMLDTSWFTLTENFLFSLKVSASGSEFAVSDQVVQIRTEGHVIPLSVDCKQCRNNWVNSNDKVTLKASCHKYAKCHQAKLRYQWKVFLVEGDDSEEESDPTNHIHSANCVNADGSLNRSLMYLAKAKAVPTTTTSTPVTTTTTAAQLLDPGVDSLDHDLEEESKPLDGFPVPPWQQDVKEQHASRGHAKSSSRGQLSRGSVGKIPHDPGFFIDIEEQLGSTRLDHKSRINNGDSGEKMEGSSRENLAGKIPPGEKTDPDLVRFKERQPPRPHITVRKGSELDLNSKLVASDPEGPSLVLRPGTLTQGLTYRVQVSVSDADDPEWRGLAMTYFKVNKSPRSGSCSVKPSKGVEMETLFTAFCKEWKDEQLPLWYELSYRLEDEPASSANTSSSSLTTPSVHKHVIYHGLSHEVTFTLPAGLPRHDRQVFLELNVRDNWGASTTICRLSVPVFPQAPAPRLHPLHARKNALLTACKDSACQQLTELQDDVRALSARLAESVYHGDLYGVQDSGQTFTHLVTRLDRLAAAALHPHPHPHHSGEGKATDNATATTTTTTTFAAAAAVAATPTATPTPSQIRFELVETLRHMTLRDMAEVGKTLSCLQYATAVISQTPWGVF